MALVLQAYYLTRQRFPNLPNATKYALALSVVLFGIFNKDHMTAEDKSVYHIFWAIATGLATVCSW